MQKKEEDLNLVSLGDYLDDNISEKTPEEQAQEDLANALEGKDGKKDPLYIDVEDEEKEVAPKGTPEEEEEESPDEGTKEEPKAEEEHRGRKGEEETEKSKSGGTSEFYKTALRKLFGEGVETLTIEEDGEDVDVSLDDLDIDEDYFQEIVEAKHEIDKQEALEGKVDITGNSEFAKKILEIDKLGGSYNDLLEMKEVYTDPLSNLNFEDVNDQKEAIFLRYKAKNNLADEEISAIIQGFEKSGTLKEKALSAKEEVESAVTKAAERREQEAIELKKKAEADEKEYKKKMKSALSSYELKDSVKENIVNISTKRGENGLYELDKIYSEMVSDPEKAAEIALYFLDRDEFLAQVSSKQVQEEKLKTARRLKITGSKKPVSQASRKKKEKSGLISLDDLT
jgi:hypothetical protein